MISNSKLSKVEIKAEYSRRYPDPLHQDLNGDLLNIEHHVLVSRAIDVPTGISKAPNPRKQRTDLAIYKKIRESLEDAEDPSFHLKNKGITILAHKVEYSEDKKIATVYFAESDGIADGAHTYNIIQETRADGVCPEGQYVKFEIITGVPNQRIADIAGGLNTAVQVDEASLLNLKKEFEWVKETLEGTPYTGDISYMQNEGGKFDIRDILSLMTLFNVNKFPDTEHPTEAYVSKAKCLDLYKEDPKSFKMLRPLLKDILYLHDYVHIRSRKRYNEKMRGKAAKMKGVYATRKRGSYEFVFMSEDEATKLFGGSPDAKLYDGALYPMLGAMRFLVEQKPGEDVYSWKLKSFEEVKSFFDEIAPDLVITTYKTSQVYGLKPNPMGKDENHWDNLYKTVALHFFNKYVSQNQATVTK